MQPYGGSLLRSTLDPVLIMDMTDSTTEYISNPYGGSSMKPKRIQRRRTKGWRMPSGAKYVGRGSRYGNHFVVKRVAYFYRVLNTLIMKGSGIFETKKDAQRRACFDYEYYLQRKYPTREALAEFLAPLKGKDLACWCPLLDKDGKPMPCHADVLLRLANA